jgi:hypothetical protein
MADTTQIAGGRPPSNPNNSYNPLAGTFFPPGTPVRQDQFHDDTVLPARADSLDTTIVTGFAVNPGVGSTLSVNLGVGPSPQRSNRVLVQYSGPLTLTVDHWAEVTGNPQGLLRDQPYFLSATDLGKLTTTAPTDDNAFVAPVGVGLSATTLFILLSFPAFNGGGSDGLRKPGTATAPTGSASGKAG